MKGSVAGFLLGAVLTSIIWWWGTGHSEKASDPQNSPYWSASGTNPANWSYKEGNHDRKPADVEDCQQLVEYRLSKEYLIWEDRLILFSNCMKKKGYEFRTDKTAAARKRR